jgi:hypothetical protein
MAGEKKAKKPMTEEQLERLALARKKANEMRKINQAKRLQNKMDNLKYNADGTLKEQLEEKELKENIEEKELKENVEEKEVKEEGTAPHAENKEVDEEKPKMTITQETDENEIQEEQVIIKKKKAKPKKKQMIIVEQSDDDSDEFESNDRVVFVKRVSKRKDPIVPPVAPNPQPIEQPKPPPPQRKTKNELLYDNMFSGGFLNPMARRF